MKFWQEMIHQRTLNRAGQLDIRKRRFVPSSSANQQSSLTPFGLEEEVVNCLK